MTANKEWLEKFMAEEQKRAHAAGMSLIQYMAQAEGGILRPTLTKLLLHSKAHPTSCPSDCAFQASLNRLKQQA